MKNPNTIRDRFRLLDELYLEWDRCWRKAEEAKALEHEEFFRDKAYWAFAAYNELVAQPIDAVLSSLWYWKNNNLNKWADADDILSVSRVINLGNATTKAIPNGMEDRKKYLMKAKKLLKI